MIVIDEKRESRMEMKAGTEFPQVSTRATRFPEREEKKVA